MENPSYKVVHQVALFKKTMQVQSIIYNLTRKRRNKIQPIIYIWTLPVFHGAQHRV